MSEKYVIVVLGKKKKGKKIKGRRKEGKDWENQIAF